MKLLRTLAPGAICCAFLLLSAPAEAQFRRKQTPEQLAAAIDRQFEIAWKQARLVPSGQCSDSEFLRRAFLDIVGTIPPESAVRKFLEESHPKKRELLVDALLKSDGYPRFASITWGNTLVGRGTGIEILQQAPFRSWLQEQFAQNVPYHQLVRSVLTAKGSAQDDPAVIWALDKNGSPEELTSSAARLFLGTQIQCAQCHDHPFDKWKQTDFYGLAAFFAGTSKQQRFLTQMIRDDPQGEIHLGGMSDAPVVAPRFLDGSRPSASGVSTNRREQLADWIIGNPQFARATVNRMWYQFHGRGLVHPVDDFGESNAASVPKVLDLLADGFADNGYDLKFLVRAITRTRTYQLSSLPSRNNQQDEELFSKARLRRQNAEQLLASVVTSSGIGDNKAVMDNPLFKLLLTAVQQQFIFVFENMDDTSEVSEFNGTISQALLMMNSKPMAGVTDINLLSPLFAKLIKLKTPDEQIELLFVHTLSRPPTRSELAEFRRQFAGVPPLKRIEICEDLYWALLNSAEFTFNH